MPPPDEPQLELEFVLIELSAPGTVATFARVVVTTLVFGVGFRSETVHPVIAAGFLFGMAVSFALVMFYRGLREGVWFQYRWYLFAVLLALCCGFLVLREELSLPQCALDSRAPVSVVSALAGSAFVGLFDRVILPALLSATPYNSGRIGGRQVLSAFLAAAALPAFIAWIVLILSPTVAQGYCASVAARRALGRMQAQARNGQVDTEAPEVAPSDLRGVLERMSPPQRRAYLQLVLGNSDDAVGLLSDAPGRSEPILRDLLGDARLLNLSDGSRLGGKRHVDVAWVGRAFDDVRRVRRSPILGEWARQSPGCASQELPPRVENPLRVWAKLLLCKETEPDALEGYGRWVRQWFSWREHLPQDPQRPVQARVLRVPSDRRNCSGLPLDPREVNQLVFGQPSPEASTTVVCSGPAGGTVLHLWEPGPRGGARWIGAIARMTITVSNSNFPLIETFQLGGGGGGWNPVTDPDYARHIVGGGQGCVLPQNLFTLPAFCLVVPTPNAGREAPLRVHLAESAPMTRRTVMRQNRRRRTP